MSERVASPTPVSDLTRARSAATPQVTLRVATPRAPDSFARLQRAAGNQAIHRLLRSAGIQPQLTVNRPDDEYEREADQVADEVMRMPATPPDIEGRTSIVQRKCAACDAHDKKEEDEAHGHVQAKRIGAPLVQRQCATCGAADHEQPGGPMVQAKSESADRPTAPREVEGYLSASRGGGDHLPAMEREFFETRFNHDFGAVRVHTGSEATRATTAINARAFTSGRDVFFGHGEYAPGSPSGRHLLAHELTHVIQQSSAPAVAPAASESHQVQRTCAACEAEDKEAQ